MATSQIGGPTDVLSAQPDCGLVLLETLIGKVNSSVNVSGVDIVVGIPNIDSCGEKASKPPKREALN
jgi:hypothetical protein